MGAVVDPPAAARWLLDHRLLTPASVVEAGVIIRDRSRSNAVHAVEVGGRPQWFVKWAADRELDEAASGWRERAVYTLASQLGANLPLARLVEASNDALALEAVDGVALSSLGRPAAGVLFAAGSAAGHWHRRAREIAPALRPAAVNPWILRIFGDDRPRFLADHPTILGLFAEIGERLADAEPDGARVAVDAARDAWQPDTVINGDLRWDNCLWHESTGALTLVDWEFAGWGDPAWDLAGLLGDAVAVAASCAEGAKVLALAMPDLVATTAGYVASGAGGNVVARALTMLPARLLLGAAQQATWGAVDGYVSSRMLATLATKLATAPGQLTSLAEPTLPRRY